jgi:hypothetical protein
MDTNALDPSNKINGSTLFLLIICLDSKWGRQDNAPDVPCIVKRTRIYETPKKVSILQFLLPLAVPWFKAFPRERIVCIILFNLIEPLIYEHHGKHKKLISLHQQILN